MHETEFEKVNYDKCENGMGDHVWRIALYNIFTTEHPGSVQTSAVASNANLGWAKHTKCKCRVLIHYIKYDFVYYVHTRRMYF